MTNLKFPPLATPLTAWKKVKENWKDEFRLYETIALKIEGRDSKDFDGEKARTEFRFNHRRGIGIRTKQPWKEKEEPITKNGWICRKPGKDSPAKQKTRIP